MVTKAPIKKDLLYFPKLGPYNLILHLLSSEAVIIYCSLTSFPSFYLSFDTSDKFNTTFTISDD